jgi:hypothetical protein
MLARINLATKRLFGYPDMSMTVAIAVLVAAFVVVVVADGVSLKTSNVVAKK